MVREQQRTEQNDHVECSEPGEAWMTTRGRDEHRFYKNNSGKAKVTVTRTVAPATLDAKPGETGQPK